jgi:hypothetical protein
MDIINNVFVLYNSKKQSNPDVKCQRLGPSADSKVLFSYYLLAYISLWDAVYDSVHDGKKIKMRTQRWKSLLRGLIEAGRVWNALRANNGNREHIKTEIHIYKTAIKPHDAEKRLGR